MALLLLLLLLCINQWRCRIWVGATTPSVPPFISISAPVSSPSLSPISAISPSMAAPSLGNLTASEEQEMEAHKRMAIALAGVCSALAAVLLSLLCLWIYRRRSNDPKSHKGNTLSSVRKHLKREIFINAEKGIPLTPFLSKLNSTWMVGKKGSVSVIDYRAIEKATGNFLESNVLGEGGFGRVYRAQLDEKLAVAVKKLDCSKQEAEIEFENEVKILSRIRHANIIRQLGCSSDGDSRFIVYELMENGSLESQLHGASHGSCLTWHMRMKIALDAARGLEYLHEKCQPAVIHRDLKTSNILLDSNFNAKLSDFGLAITEGSLNKKNIKLSGTLGYVAPEYLLHGKLTEKSDVYAFGVVLLELLLGRRPVENVATPPQCQSIVTWAMPQLTDKTKLPSIVDSVIRDTMDVKHLYQVAATAVLCVQQEPTYRPLITDVLHSLVPLVPLELGGTLRLTS